MDVLHLRPQALDIILPHHLMELVYLLHLLQAQLEVMVGVEGTAVMVETEEMAGMEATVEMEELLRNHRISLPQLPSHIQPQ